MVVHFYLSGFSSFFKCKDNPTQVIVDGIAKNHGDSGASWELPASRVLSVATGPVDKYLEECISDAHCKGSKDHVVLLHLGVATRSTKFHIERHAVNDKSFRCPDEDGYQPKDTPIDDSKPLSEPLPTWLDVDALTAELVTAGHDAEVSTDCGKFVCNYTFYRSLQVAAAANATAHANAEGGVQPARCHSLFVHVPLAEVTAIEAQVAFVRALMDAIARRLAADEKEGGH